VLSPAHTDSKEERSVKQRRSCFLGCGGCESAFLLRFSQCRPPGQSTSRRRA
jgi:hypothetical protein